MEENNNVNNNDHIKIEKDYRYRIKVIASYLVIAFLFFCFKTKIESSFHDYILPLLDIEYNSTTNIIFIVLSTLLFTSKIYQNYIHKKELSFIHIVSLIFILISYIFIRCFLYKDKYCFLPENSLICYLDIIPIIALSYLTIHSYNHTYNRIQRKKNKSTDDFFIADEPLIDSKNDLFGFDEHAKMIAEKIGQISPRTHFSLGILSEWGAGKSTYLNFLKNALKKKEFIIVDFNPRHSFETKTIQEDFFNTLNNQLKNHNSIFSSLIVDYMKAMGIIGKNNSLSVLLNIYKVWNKETEKQRLNKAIDTLPNRVVVFIEDLDRLLAEEIIEVFKLIDGNASLNNMIFISAYDKQHINKILEEKYQHESSKFSDKFFSWEIELPKEKYDKTIDYLLENLFNRIDIDPTSINAFKAYFKSRQSTIENYIQTIRDAKRFINAFTENYSHISEYVLLDDYFCLQLIKYKCYNTYLGLYRREYLVTNPDDFSKFKLKDNLPADTEALEILNFIFKKSYKKEYNSISNTTSFDDYFRTHSSKIELKELRTLIIEEDNKVTFKKLDYWYKENKIKIVLEYLETIKVSEIENIENVLRYLDVLIYISINFKTNIYNLISILFISYTAKDIIENTKVTKVEYKNNLEKVLKGEVGKYPYILLRQLLINSFDDPDSCEFTSEELQKIAKHYLEDYIKNKANINESLEIELLYCCINKIEPGTRIIHLNVEMCTKTKDYIINNPNFYIENFIRIEMVSNDKHTFLLTCEPFWNQIFGNAFNMKRFIGASRLDKMNNIKLIRNFWKLYENNNYKPIKFNNAEMTYEENIADNFEKGCQQLYKLLRYQKRFYEIKNTLKNYSTQALEIRDILKQLDDINLYISKKKEIIDEMSNYIREIE